MSSLLPFTGIYIGISLVLIPGLTSSPCFIKGLRVDSLTKTVRTVKILAVDMDAISLDGVLDFMRCFNSVEKQYIQVTILL